jgi:hypothetical protein
MTDRPELALRLNVLTVLQVALLDMVTPSLRGVTVTWNEQAIDVGMLFDGAVGELDEERASDVEAELMASFPDHRVRVAAERYDAPAPLNARTTKAWVYRRFEER